MREHYSNLSIQVILFLLGALDAKMDRILELLGG